MIDETSQANAQKLADAVQELTSEVRGLLQSLAEYEGNPVTINKHSGMVRALGKALDAVYAAQAAIVTSS